MRLSCDGYDVFAVQAHRIYPSFGELMCHVATLFLLALPACLSQVIDIGNGRCNIENNTPECNYDGGDCCECTCDPTNGDDDFSCMEFS